MINDSLADILVAYLAGTLPRVILADFLEEQGDARAPRVRHLRRGREFILRTLFPEYGCWTTYARGPLGDEDGDDGGASSMARGRGRVCRVWRHGPKVDANLQAMEKVRAMYGQFDAGPRGR